MKIKKTIGAGLVSLGLVVGSAGLAGAVTATPSTIETTGPDSVNVIKERASQEVEIENENEIKAKNVTIQKAETGEAEAEHNTTVDDAESGSASNEAILDATVEIDNSGSLAEVADPIVEPTVMENAGTIETTGPDSVNIVKFENKSEVEIENENELYISNFVMQKAETGDAEVEDNTTGGDAISGDAANESSVSMSFTITN